MIDFFVMAPVPVVATAAAKLSDKVRVSSGMTTTCGAAVSNSRMRSRRMTISALSRSDASLKAAISSSFSLRSGQDSQSFAARGFLFSFAKTAKRTREKTPSAIKTARIT